MTRAFASLFFLLAFSFCLAAEARACGCMFSFSTSQPCAAYWKAEIVFAGTVTQVGPMTPVEGTSGRLFTTNGRFTRFSVDEAFRGVQGGTFETFDHGTSCDYSFKPGERYFVYGSRDVKDGKVYVSSCSATKSLDRAENDQAYARGVILKEPTPSITGLVVRETRARADNYRNRTGFEGIRVLAESDGRTAETFTDANGIFRFFGLAPGNYKLRALTPPELRRVYGQEVLNVQVIAGRCAGGEFNVTSLSTIRGRVFDSEGAPAKTKVSLVALDSEGKELNAAEGSIESYSDEQGNYKFDLLAPGRYLVAINWRNQPGTSDPPYPRTYLPGVADRTLATVIEVFEGEQVAAGEFYLPSPLKRRTIEGIALFPDGRPAANALVMLVFTDRKWFEVETADAQGHFTLKVYDGFKYLIAAEVRKQVQGVWRGTHSAPAEVLAGPINRPLELIVSQPGFYTHGSARGRQEE